MITVFIVRQGQDLQISTHSYVVHQIFSGAKTKFCNFLGLLLAKMIFRGIQPEVKNNITISGQRYIFGMNDLHYIHPSHMTPFSVAVNHKAASQASNDMQACLNINSLNPLRYNEWNR